MGYAYPRLIHLMALALGSTQDAAETEARDLLHRWYGQGILRRKGRPTS
jgi:hypothetical protein